MFDKWKLERAQEKIRDIEQYITPMIQGVNEKCRGKRFSFVDVKPGLRTYDLFIYSLDYEEVVKISYQLAVEKKCYVESIANGMPGFYIIVIQARIEDLVYHPEDVFSIKENDCTTSKTISLRPIDVPHIKESLCEDFIRNSKEVKELSEQALFITTKVKQYLDSNYKNDRIYVGSTYNQIEVYKKIAQGEPEQYREYFMDFVILSLFKKYVRRDLNRIKETAKDYGLDLKIDREEILKHIEYKKKHGYKYIGPYNTIRNQKSLERGDYSLNLDSILTVEEVEKALSSNGTKKETYKDGSYYEGEMKDGFRHGQGVYVWDDGDKYVGQFVKGVRQGKGTYYWKNGSKYDGEWQNGKKHGNGIIYYQDGTSNKVVYDNNKVVSTSPNNIKKKYKDGSYYEGEMKGDIRHGKGTYCWSNGEKYVGDFVDGVRQGEGTYYWENGNKYIGQFSNGKRHGKGTIYYSKSGNKYVGDWNKGLKHGKGIVYYKNGTKEKVVYENDKCIDRKLIK